MYSRPLVEQQYIYRAPLDYRRPEGFSMFAMQQQGNIVLEQYQLDKHILQFTDEDFIHTLGAFLENPDILMQIDIAQWMPCGR